MAEKSHWSLVKTRSVRQFRTVNLLERTFRRCNARVRLDRGGFWLRERPSQQESHMQDHSSASFQS